MPPSTVPTLDWDRVLDIIEELEALPPSEVEDRLGSLEAAGEAADALRRIRLHFRMPVVQQEIPPHTLIGGQYRIMGCLGRGGMGIVYEAVLEMTGQTVALKMIHPDLIRPEMQARFLREMRVLGQLDHPGIVAIRHAGSHTFQSTGQSSEFFTMERVPGTTLHQYLKESGANWVEKLRIVRDVAIAVGYAHDRQVIHRDLKPGNMIVRSDGRVMIFDFGLAAALLSYESDSSISHIEGTPPYMAPEQAAGAPPDAAADIYSLGAILYEMLSGEPLYRVNPLSPRSVMLQTVLNPPPLPRLSLPDAPPALLAILDKSVALDPGDRFASAAAFARALNRLLPAHLVREPPHAWRPAKNATIPATDWVLEEKLGDGAHGDVWLAQNCPELTPRSNSFAPPPRVYKFCASEEAARSLRREQRVFQALRRSMDSATTGSTGLPESPEASEPVTPHPTLPGIVPLEAWSLDDPPYYIAMRYIEGAVDLNRWVENVRRAQAADALDAVLSVPPSLESAAVSIVCFVAEALQFASQHGVIHRDVSPANILVLDVPKSPGGVQAWLLDFGLADFDASFARSLLTHSLTETRHRIAGSPEYIAPEIKRGSAATTQSDIYSLGVVFYRLLRGDFTATLTEWKQHITDPFLREDLEHCLADSPSDRFASANALAERLKALPSRRAWAHEEEQARTKAHADRAVELAAAERAAYRKGLFLAGAIASVIITAITWLALFSYRQYQAAWRNESQLRLAEVRALRQSSVPARRQRILSRIAEADGRYLPPDIPQLRREVIAAMSMISHTPLNTKLAGKLPPGSSVRAAGKWIGWAEGPLLRRARLEEDSLHDVPSASFAADIANHAMCATGELAAVVLRSGELYAVDREGMTELVAHDCGTEGLAVHSSGMIAAPGSGGQIKLFARAGGRWAQRALLGNPPPNPDRLSMPDPPETPFVASAELLEFRPDGEWLAMGSASSLYVQIWDTADGTLMARCLNRDFPTVIRWDPIFQPRLYVACMNGELRSWELDGRNDDLLDPRFLAASVGQAPVRAMDICPDSSQLMCIMEDGTRVILSPETLGLEEREERVDLLDAGFVPDGGLWAVLRDGSLTLNSMDSTKALVRRVGDDPVVRLTVSPDHSLVAASCGEAVVVAETSFRSMQLLKSDNLMRGVAFSPFEPLLFASAANGMQVWQWTDRGQGSASFALAGYWNDSPHNGEAVSLDWNGQRWLVLSSATELEARCNATSDSWDLSALAPVNAVAAPTSQSWFAIARKGSHYAEVCDLAKRSRRALPSASTEVLALACSPDGALILERTSAAFTVRETVSGRTTWAREVPLPPPDSTKTGFHSTPLALDASGSIAAVASSNGTVLLFAKTEEAPVAELTLPGGGTATALAFTAGPNLVAGTSAGQIVLWKVIEMRRHLDALKLDWHGRTPDPPNPPPLRLHSSG